MKKIKDSDSAPKKTGVVEGWEDLKSAIRIIKESQERYNMKQESNLGQR